MPKIELSKKYQTKSELSVEILKTGVNNGEGYSTVGLVTEEDGHQTVETWTEDGVFNIGRESTYDLVEVKEMKEMWLEIYNDTRNGMICSFCHPNKPLVVYYYFDENGEGYWYVGKQCAGTSDLKVDLISAGDTPKEALDKARKYLNKKVDK